MIKLVFVFDKHVACIFFKTKKCTLRAFFLKQKNVLSLHFSRSISNENLLKIFIFTELSIKNFYNLVFTVLHEILVFKTL